MSVTKINIVQARLGHSMQSHCLDELKGTLSLGCPHNQLIKLGKVFYGYSWSSDCSYIEKDCTMDVPKEDIICLTTTNCTIKVVEYPLILQDCWNLVASYVQAEFECIAEYSLQNVCQAQDTTLSYGFISSPTYPQGFQSNLNCPCALFASPGHAIVLEVIDFRLPSCAEAGLILWMGSDYQTKCLTQDPLTVVGNVQQNVTLRFYTLNNMKHGGFLIKYSVLPVSNNATVRLQCYTAPSNQQQKMTIPPPTVIPPFPFGAKTDDDSIEQDAMNIIIDDLNSNGNSYKPATHPTDLSKRFTISNDPPPILGTLQEHRQNTKQFIVLDLLPNNVRRSNITLIVICAVAAVIFLLIMINALIWFIFSLRPQCKSTMSFQHLAYPGGDLSHHHQRGTKELSITDSTTAVLNPNRLHDYPDDASSLSRLNLTNYLRKHNFPPPQPSVNAPPYRPMFTSQNKNDSSPDLHSESELTEFGGGISPPRRLNKKSGITSNRLKAIRSLVLRGHKTLPNDNTSRLDSTISDYHLRSVSQVPGDSVVKPNYEEQEDCVELRSESSHLSNIRNNNRLKAAKKKESPRQINSWDDI
ncbi:unnamed protein product [Didymodactylos carnosus]|uniref:CUB domain-containing protein n=1 Tax=Didymodactylos carnosus TaxID=1234261 RepID=A0A814BMX7_9BILA|nr:unnamed protein product [Didymodactylos carnosus]CAF1032237.1 unnamed protein product [Didymodactylos carnosus]CAF3706715.1 unnamed protein product [Didymodactylos carnosus]CAF3800503.1 unnamed protein product [Didymodactylos carnosus]